MRLQKALLALFTCAVIATSLAACGRRNDLHPPPGAEDSDYPRAYPAPSP
jgi:predicted small lipoprotein YifL